MLGLANKPTSVFKSLSLLPMQQGGGAVLGAPGDVYIITDTRKNPRKDLSKMSTFQKFDTRKLNVENLQKMSEDDPLLYEEIKSGLGKPTVKFEFEDNADLMNFFAKSDGKEYSNAQNVDFENVATSTSTNGKRGASRAQSAITTPETLYLPYSEGSKALPGSANPKSLPPASQNIPQPSSPKALPPSGLENDETFIPFGYEKKALLEPTTAERTAPKETQGYLDTMNLIHKVLDTYNQYLDLKKQNSVSKIDSFENDKKQLFESIRKDERLIYDKISDLFDAQEFESLSKIFDYVIDNNMFRFDHKIWKFNRVFSVNNKVFIVKKGNNKEGHYYAVFCPYSKPFIKFAHNNKAKWDGESWLFPLDKFERIKNELINLFSDNLSGLGKPTVKFEFEDNDEIFKTFGAGINGLIVNDKPAALFNCPESLLQCKGFTPSYIRLEDYSALIEPATDEKKLVGYGFEVATLNELANACNHYNDVARLASHLKADNVLQSAFNVWHWLHTNIKYNYDTPGEEEIRTPARSWADRENGVDCDCIAVFTACLLGAMGYKPKFEIVAFNNSPKYSHIYVNLDGAAIDRVLPVFLARPENITKTKIMDIPVFELSGTADGGFSTLNGIYADTLLKVNSGTANAQDSMDLRKTQVLLGLQKSDPQAYKLAAILMPYVVAIDDNGSYYFANDKVAEIAENADKKLYSLKISGAKQADFDDFFNSIVGEMKNISVRLERGNGKTVVTISFTNPQNDTYNVEGEYVKKDMLAINPDFLTMRNALKNLIAVNYYDLATRFTVGLMTEQNAVQAGYTPETWQKAVLATNKLKKLWTLLGGDVETLIHVIESGSEKEPVVEVDGDTSIIETSAFDSVLHGCKYNALSGINGLGETSTVNSELDTLGDGFETLLEWIAEIEPGETVNISITKTSDGESNIRYASTMPDSESNNKAWLWLLGGAVVGSGIAAATSGKKNKKSKR